MGLTGRNDASWVGYLLLGKIQNKMRKIINWFKMQWEIFQYIESVEATNGNSPNWKVDEKIKQIKKKYRTK